MFVGFCDVLGFGFGFEPNIFAILSPAFLVLMFVVFGFGGGGFCVFFRLMRDLNLSVIPSPVITTPLLNTCCRVNLPVSGLYFF